LSGFRVLGNIFDHDAGSAERAGAFSMNNLHNAVVAKGVPALDARWLFKYFMAHTAQGPFGRWHDQQIIKRGFRFNLEPALVVIVVVVVVVGIVVIVVIVVIAAVVLLLLWLLWLVVLFFAVLGRVMMKVS
jgi:hypothetical protein